MLARIAEGLGKAAAAMAAEEVVPRLHAHVGTNIETGEEVDFVLEHVDDRVLLVGPDTGHLSWAGVDLMPSSHAMPAVSVRSISKIIASPWPTPSGRRARDIGLPMAPISGPSRGGSVDLDGALAALSVDCQ